MEEIKELTSSGRSLRGYGRFPYRQSPSDTLRVEISFTILATSAVGISFVHILLGPRCPLIRQIR